MHDQLRTGEPRRVDLAVPDQVRRFTEAFTAVWWRSENTTPNLGRTFSPQDQANREAQLDRFQESVASEAARVPRTRAERQAVQERVLASFRAFARVALGFGEGHMDALLERGLPQIGSQFAQAARRFDSKISGPEIFQALRNVWTMNCLQLLLGVPIQLTRAVFAYSMLYPYTDNYLDDPEVAEATKVAFNDRFAARLKP